MDALEPRNPAFEFCDACNNYGWFGIWADGSSHPANPQIQRCDLCDRCEDDGAAFLEALRYLVQHFDRPDVSPHPELEEHIATWFVNAFLEDAMSPPCYAKEPK